MEEDGDKVQAAILFRDWLQGLRPSQTVTALHSAFGDYLHIYDEADLTVRNKVLLFLAVYLTRAGRP